jgi:hypothetical protein
MIFFCTDSSEGDWADPLTGVVQSAGSGSPSSISFWGVVQSILMGLTAVSLRCLRLSDETGVIGFNRFNDSTLGEALTGEARTGEVRTGEVRTGEVRTVRSTLLDPLELETPLALEDPLLLEDLRVLEDPFVAEEPFTLETTSWSRPLSRPIDPQTSTGVLPLASLAFRFAPFPTR